MAVTPNILEDGNYVHTIEYPFAKTAEKPILPVKIVPTNRKRIEECYDNIPKCIDC